MDNIYITKSFRIDKKDIVYPARVEEINFIESTMTVYNEEIGRLKLFPMAELIISFNRIEGWIEFVVGESEWKKVANAIIATKNILIERNLL